MKYDWVALKQKYLLSGYKNLKEFAESENIKYDLLRQNAIGWKKEKLTKVSQNHHKITNKIGARQVKEAVESYATINKKHYDLADELIKKLKELKPKNALDVESMTRALKNLQQVQRTAKGMDKLESEALTEGLEIVVNDKKRKK